MKKNDSRCAPIATTCAYCGVGCGVLATPDGAGGAKISGDPEHPANFGRLCSKGSALGETLGLEARLLHPMRRTTNGFAEIAWDEALDVVAEGFRRVIERDGPNAVAFYLSGQLLTEDYYVANKLMKGFIGSANVDTNSRLCMSSAVAGHKRAFGADVVPGCYEDLDEADLIVLTGSNATWCHPVLFQRMLRNRTERGARLVVIDPRRTATAEEADLFLSIKPGSDAALFCGLLVHLAKNGALDEGFIADHTEGFAEALARARAIAPTIGATALATGLRQADVAEFFEAFVATPRTVTAFSQGVNQSAQGVDKVNAIINCHLATGRIGKPGAGPFSLTGQPNAMGGREAGGLANQLAAHMGFSAQEIDCARRFWKAERMATREGLKAVDMFEAIARGEIRALWVMGTNPAVSLPRADRVREALECLELFVISDNVRSNDTINSGAHVLLPALAWGEKSGTVTNSERRISRQRAFLDAPGEAKPDWLIVSEVARRLGFGDAFPYRSSADVFREHAALSGFENEGARAFDIGGLAELTDDDYDRLPPTIWPVRRGEAAQPKRFFAAGRFFTPDKRARLVAPERPALAVQASARYPFRLNTGRVRDQWHTMARTGASPRLARHAPEPFVEIHPEDAAAFAIVDGDFALVSTAHGDCVLKAVVTSGQQRGQLFAPIHWSAETASCARVGALVASATDPVSGQPEAKATPARIAPYLYETRGFILSAHPVTAPQGTWWARVAVSKGWGLLLASDDTARSWRERWRAACRAEPMEYFDEARGIYRAAVFVDDRLEQCLFVGSADAGPSFESVEAALGETLEPGRRIALLAGKGVRGAEPRDGGKTVCACFNVSAKAINDEIARGADTLAKLQARLRAGTNCGSCVPELKRAIAQAEDGGLRRDRAA